MSGVPTRSPRASVTTAGRLVAAGILYLLSLLFMAITIGIRFVVYAFFILAAIAVSFAIAGVETPSIVGDLYWVGAFVIIAWSLYWTGRRVWAGGRTEAASHLARTRLPRPEDRGVQSTLDRLAQSLDRPVPALRISETDQPLCFTIKYPTTNPPRDELERDVGAYRAFSTDEVLSDTDFDADEPIPEDYVIVVSTGLLSALTADELAAVLAHELAHLHNGDPRLMTLFLVPLGWSERAIPTSGRLIATIILGIPAVLMVAAAVLAMAVFARGREYDADAGAAAITGDPSALASALERLREDAQRPEEDLRRVSVLNVLPTGDDFWDRLHHPSTERRIKKLRSMTTANGASISTTNLPRN